MTGVVLLDKPLGLSSAKAAFRVKRILGAAKAGHTGTLDPAASGLLLVCLGGATRFTPYLQEGDKEYEAELALGCETVTGDAFGEITARFPVKASLADVQAILPRFTGKLLQTPPAYSALKSHGTPLYRLALQGVEVELTPREITIYSLTLLGQTGRNRYALRVVCSKGTYIRSLCADIGRALNSGGYLSALRRVRSGLAKVENAYTLPALEQAVNAEAPASYLLPPDSLLPQPPLFITPLHATRLHNGLPVTLEGEQRPAGENTENIYKIYARGNQSNSFLGLAQRQADANAFTLRTLVTYRPERGARGE